MMSPESAPVVDSDAFAELSADDAARFLFQLSQHHPNSDGVLKSFAEISNGRDTPAARSRAAAVSTLGDKGASTLSATSTAGASEKAAPRRPSAEPRNLQPQLAGDDSGDAGKASKGGADVGTSNGAEAGWATKGVASAGGKGDATVEAGRKGGAGGVANGAAAKPGSNYFDFLGDVLASADSLPVADDGSEDNAKDNEDEDDAMEEEEEEEDAGLGIGAGGRAVRGQDVNDGANAAQVDDSGGEVDAQMNDEEGEDARSMMSWDAGSVASDGQEFDVDVSGLLRRRNSVIYDVGATELTDDHIKNMLQDTSDIQLNVPRLADDWNGEEEEWWRLPGLSDGGICPALQMLPPKRLLARPCIGDDGGLAPQLLELFERNTRRISGEAGIGLPFRMRRKGGAPSGESEQGEAMTIEEIEKMASGGMPGYQALRSKCMELQLDTTGKKAVLVRRLMERFGLVEESDDEVGLRPRGVLANNPSPRTLFDPDLEWRGKTGIYALEFATGTRDGEWCVKVIIGAVGLDPDAVSGFNERVRKYHCNEVTHANVTVFPCRRGSYFNQAVLGDVEECFKVNGRSRRTTQSLGEEVFIFGDFDESEDYVLWMGMEIESLESSGKLEIPRFAHEPTGRKVNINKKSPDYCKADELRKEKEKTKRAKLRKDNAEYEKRKNAFDEKSFEQKVQYIKRQGKGPQYTMDWGGGGSAPKYVRDWATEMRSEMRKGALHQDKVELLRMEINVHPSGKSAAADKQGDKSREKKRAHLHTFQVDFPGKRPSPELNFPSESYNLGRLIENDLVYLNRRTKTNKKRISSETSSFMKTVRMYANDFHLKEFEGAVNRKGEWRPDHPRHSSVVSRSEWCEKNGIEEEEAPPEVKSFSQCVCGEHDGVVRLGSFFFTIVCDECAACCKIATRCGKRPTVIEEAKKEEWRCPDCKAAS